MSWVCPIDKVVVLDTEACQFCGLLPPSERKEVPAKEPVITDAELFMLPKLGHQREPGRFYRGERPAQVPLCVKKGWRIELEDGKPVMMTNNDDSVEQLISIPTKDFQRMLKESSERTIKAINDAPAPIAGENIVRQILKGSPDEVSKTISTLKTLLSEVDNATELGKLIIELKGQQ